MSNIALTMERTFDAPIEKVFNAWTDPAVVAKWFGPEGVDTEIHEMNVEEGGTYSLTMKGSEGKLYPLHGVFKTIDAPRKLVMTWQWEKTEQITDWTNETLVTVELNDVDGKTVMSFTHEQLFDEEAKKMHDEGWASSFDKLDKIVAN